MNNFFIFLSHAVVSADIRISFVNNIYTQHYIRTKLIVEKPRLRQASTEQNSTEILLDVNYTVSSLSYCFNNKSSVGHMKQIYM